MPFVKRIGYQLNDNMIDLHEFCEALIKTCFYKVHEPEKTDLGKFEPVTKILFVNITNLLSDKKNLFKHTKQCIYFYKKNILCCSLN